MKIKLILYNKLWIHIISLMKIRIIKIVNLIFVVWKEGGIIKKIDIKL